ncbi:hypothetical protein PFICI_01986 [Pestalotiopsis fici W106-1]|uniref:Zn(2)-C6 fungal-type domain-containing protein n=1 Tax=Pestalotiopsis fici (strain W106-1 / CGMCC3.15140) TaxID=1229662 RepID=W3XQ29_PESFW|nr:uncharacterized protein PFICI_01986 [Pestalotiopsis fici W106-1]ETS88158.1 hypothetical protein PFICI_01986 [Pestalotiopsis fici W106-1]
MDIADARHDVAPSVPIRRNGKPHSCEPCRLSKIRCDHKLPVCDRCVLRRMEKRCIYHPAPMTKSRSSRPPASAQTRRSSVISPTVAAPVAQALSFPDNVQPTCTGSTSSSSTPRTSHPADAGFFGPTAFSAVINDDQEVITQHVKQLCEQQFPHSERQSQKNIPEGRIQAGMKALHLLMEFPTFPECINRYLEISYTCMVPDPFVKACVTSLQQTLHAFNTSPNESSAADLRQLVMTLCTNTAKPLDILTHIAAKDYHTLFTGSNLRWEIIGFILALLGVSFKYDINRRSEPLRALSPTEQPTFIHRITEAVEYCSSVCFSYNAVNHQALWLLYGEACLKNVVFGDTSFQLWRCIGDLSSMFSALGLHQAVIGSEEAHPYYQCELRRRYAAQIFSMDKTTSTLLGRPPRISGAHYAITMPADVDDNVLLLDDIELQTTLSSADSNGWNLDRKFRGATWRRLKFIISQFREEVLEICLGVRHTEDIESSIYDLLTRHQYVWDQVPPELKYNEVTGSQHIDPPQRYVLMTTYMDQNYNHFLLYRKLAKESRRMPEPLYRISRSLLATTLQVTSLSDQVYSMQRDMSWFILYYGLPAASILAVGLLKDSLHDPNDPSAPKAAIPRAETVQNLPAPALDGDPLDFYNFMNRVEDAGWTRDIWDFPMEI